MYLYIELWSAKEAWLKLTTAERQAKLSQLLTLAQQHPIEGVVPFSFRPVGAVTLFDGIVERPVIVSDEVARPTGYHYAAAWMVPTRELIDEFEKRVEGLGWWWDYFVQQNAWGVMDREGTVNDMISGNPNTLGNPVRGQSSSPRQPTPTHHVIAPGSPQTASQGGESGSSDDADREAVLAAVRTYFTDFFIGDYAGAISLMMPGIKTFAPYGGLQHAPANVQDIAVQFSRLHAQGFNYQFVPNDINIDMYGNVGVAMFMLEGMQTPPVPGGKPYAVEHRGTQVWIKRDNEWVMAHMHISSNDERENWRGTTPDLVKQTANK